MSNVNIREVFCEVLSGLALLFSVQAILDVFQIHCIDQTIVFMKTHMTASTFGFILLFSYVLGLIMDAIGLAIGEAFLDKLLKIVPPSSHEKAIFWKNVNEHVLTYRSIQWAFFSSYRNLFILFIPGGLFWTILTWKKYNWCYGIVTGIAFLILEIVLFKSMKVLLGLYCEITIKGVTH